MSRTRRPGSSSAPAPADEPALPPAPELSDLPELVHHQRLVLDERDRVAAALRAHYESGRTLRELTAATGYSLGRVRRLLLGAGTELRPRSRRHSSAADSNRE